jgi:hypothetical protein
VKATAMFALLSAGMIAASALLLAQLFHAPGDAHAIRVSAAVAWPVQMLTFAVARLAGREQMLVAWGIGALVRFGTLAVYALVMVRALNLQPTAALISLATYFFLTMLVEPLLLTK